MDNNTKTVELKPQYKLDHIASTVAFPETDSIDNFIGSLNEEYTIIVWQHQGLYKGIIKNGNITIENEVKMICVFEMEAKHWIRARIFNKKEEYYLRNINGKMKVRHRRDEDGTDSEIIDSTAVLRGAIVQDENSEKTERIEIRNYLGYNATGVVQVEDMRFVKIIKG